MQFLFLFKQPVFPQLCQAAAEHIMQKDNHKAERLVQAKKKMHVNIGTKINQTSMSCLNPHPNLRLFWQNLKNFRIQQIRW